MAMERVTVEQNGERFTLEVPEGTSDDDIQSFLMQQTAGNATENKQQMLTAPPQPADYAMNGGVGAVRPLAQAYWEGPAKGVSRDLYDMGKILSQADTKTAMELAKNPYEFTKAYIQGHPWSDSLKNIGSVPGKLGNFAKNVGYGLVTAPENAAMLPYNMAAYEQEKIRNNPNLPEYANNPYAQTIRGEASTQNRAGQANQMRTVANMPYGNVTPQEYKMLEEDRMMKDAIRKKAFQKVMGPVAPTNLQ
jgi:hypothetical protein